LQTLYYISYLFELLPFIFCICFFRKINTRNLRVFFYYSSILALFAILAVVLKTFIKVKSLMILNVEIYLIVEYLILSFFFYYLLRNIIVKKIILTFIPIFTVFAIYCFFYNLTPLPFITEFLIFIILLLFYFYEKMKVFTKYPLYQSISFWLCVGLFIYFTGNLFYLLFLNYSKDSSFIKQLKTICYLVNISKDFVLAFAWFAHERIETDTNMIKFPNGLGLDDDLPFHKPNHA
jgi:hypothetical protein